MQKSKVSIVGAGIPGLSLALMLADHNIEVMLFDKAALPTIADIKPSGRTAALMQNSLKVLEKTGVWPEFKPYATALSRLSIIDDSDFPRGEKTMVRQDFTADEIGHEVFGYNCPLGMLTAALADKAKAHDNIIVAEASDIQADDVRITQADLIVGADGRNSIVRTWAGIESETKDYGQSVITCLISHSQPHYNTSTEFHRSGGPCTFVPCGDNQSAVVWVEKTEDADAFIKLPKSAFIQALQERSRDFLGQIDLVDGPSSRPLMTLKANRMVAAKTVLIAEAAHVLSPIGAQGLNLSLRDADMLAEMILNALKTGQDIGSATFLKNYERKRLRDINLRYRGVDIFNRFVANDNPIVKGLRRLGLRAIGYGGPLRQMLMQEGLSPKS